MPSTLLIVTILPAFKDAKSPNTQFVSFAKKKVGFTKVVIANYRYDTLT
ncbi:hypothetical protein AM1_3394 [Acaryochloris marina MBIC11017]|uniref:Uncharacterized protein n=1 Tax=Acaryochloris marina (strain MBIC 11017) TaxID=329726 RepID=B0C041_ACAM1|nr:hypothetical protein AM1_3394 [Acaryochloris marina MBIC11017]